MPGPETPSMQGAPGPGDEGIENMELAETIAYAQKRYVEAAKRSEQIGSYEQAQALRRKADFIAEEVEKDPSQAEVYKMASDYLNEIFVMVVMQKPKEVVVFDVCGDERLARDFMHYSPKKEPADRRRVSRIVWHSLRAKQRSRPIREAEDQEGLIEHCFPTRMDSLERVLSYDRTKVTKREPKGLLQKEFYRYNKSV